MLIERNEYLDKLKPFVGKNVIKILSGLRRSGKSTLLKLFINKLEENGIESNHIIYINYTSLDLENRTDGLKMYEEIKKKIVDKNKYYILLDELQIIPSWDGVVNKLFEEENVDIYLAGSSSDLLSSELSSHLSGRFVTLSMFTLSFREYLSFKGIEIPNLSRENIYSYMREGGFPGIISENYERENELQIIEGIFSSIVLKDIITRYKIKNVDLFSRVVQFLFDNVGNTFSANKISLFLKSENRYISIETIYSYIKYLEDAFVIYPCQRYDIKGKTFLKTQEKYYLSEISLRYAQRPFSSVMVPSIVENIVFLELKRRSYDIYIGKLEERKIDFIGVKKNEKIYIQTTTMLNDSDKEREIKNLKSITDNYKKFVVYLEGYSDDNIDGIKIVRLDSFLLSNDF